MFISENVKSILNNYDTKKVIATISEEGKVHVTFKDLVFIDENNEIVLLEILEKSMTNKNLVCSIWFNKSVAINFLSKDNRSFYFQVLPRRALVSGKKFEKYYQLVRDKMEGADLSTVWTFEILEFDEKTLMKQIERHSNEYPIINHLDRLIIR